MRMLLLAAVAIAGVLPAPALAAQRPTTHGVFNVNCFSSHKAPDDPIVFPGAPGASHLHEFFGNTATGAFSTPDSLRAGETNCEHYAPSTGRRGDQAGYWTPALLVNGLPVTARRATAYYESGPRDTSQIKPFPAQMKMIAGDAKGIVDWRPRLNFVCGGGAADTLVKGTRTTAPTCVPGVDLIGRVGFQDCWDGANEDSPDHKAHVAYSARGTDGVYRCPASHPVELPQLTLEVLYPTDAGPTTRLASGDMSTWHADFMNGWTMDKHTQLVCDCLVPDLYCGGRDGPVNP